ncbi:hypothetical protein [Tateyamaria pelophila]|uniref:hypothetical protein n=1 Tax=Tateyamaria pelophila TaxID=328415 RepID=UPI001CBE847E|nr:hypothetical protein [Tateyamaria pelophila]
MLFEKCARLIAYFTLVVGIVRVVVGVFVAIILDGDPAAIANLLGRVENSGEAINQGIMIIAVGVLMGVLVQISRSVRLNERKSDEANIWIS